MKAFPKNSITSQTTIDYLLKCFFYSTTLPVSYHHNNNIVYQYPETIPSIETLIKIKDKRVSVLQYENSIEIEQNSFFETRIILNIDRKQFIVVGPFLNNEIENGTITNMIRNETIPFHKKTEVINYYKSLQVLDNERTYFTARLLQQLFSSNKIKDKDNSVLFKNNNIVEEQFINQKNENRKKLFLHSPYFIEQEVCKYISKGDIENSKECLKEINLIPHAKLASSSLRSYKNSMIGSCSFMTRAAISGGVNQDEAFTLSDAFINEIENKQTIEELESLEITMAETFAKQVKKVNNQKYSPSILKCIYYIDNHLCEDLSIKHLAKEIYLNPCYLSDLFHKETGITISNWIKKKRIEESVHLLLNSNSSIAEIAFFYCFCSQSYYIQSFKKIMGVTPNEYKQNHSN